MLLRYRSPAIKKTYPKNLLDLSKLDPGTLVLGFGERNLRHLVQHVMASFRPQAQTEGGSGLGLAIVKGIVEAPGG